MEILSPELGWQAAPNLGGSRYEAVAAERLRTGGRARLLLPGSQAAGWPRSRRVGRLWLPAGNRAGILATYLPLQLLLEIHRWRPRALRLHSITHLGPAGLIAARLARRAGWDGKVVVHVHHVDATGAAEYPRGRVARELDRWILQRVDRVIAPSNATRRALEVAFPSSTGKIVVVPNALPPPPRQHFGATRRASLRVAWIGRLDRRKRPLLFVEACRRVARQRPIEARIVGTGPLENAVNAAAADLPIEHERALPSLEPLYAWADIVVCTSSIEGFYLVGLEALQRGVPVIAFDIPALRELLGPSLADGLVPNADLEVLAGRLAGLNNQELDDLSRRATRRAGAFSVERFGEQLEAALLGDERAVSG